MSTAIADPHLAARLRVIAEKGTPAQKARALELYDERKQAAERSRLDAPFLLPWQRPLAHLALGWDWREEWGAPPSMPPRLIVVVAPNQVGKSVVQGFVIAAHLSGRSKRFTRPGEVWGGMPRLSDSVAVQRKHVEDWLGKERGRWLPREAGVPTETLIRTKAGWTGRLKAYEQDANAWESGTLQAAYLDEPPSDRIVNALKVRTMREDGFVLAIFTPIRDERSNPDFKGTESELYRATWEPWLAYKRERPERTFGEVTPGTWVFTVGARDNAVSRGGFVPDQRLEADRAALIAQGRALEAAVRYDGEWVDIAADSLLPHDMLREWSVEPRGGFTRLHCRIDPAYSAKTASCESALALWAADNEGRLYQVESLHGRWASDERLRVCADTLVAYGCPDASVQRVPGDVVFADELNRELMRRGKRACVRALPESGPVPDKVTRAQQFAPMIANGQVYVRPEHVEFRAQARKLSAAYLRAGGFVDIVDAGMGAALALVQSVPAAMFASAVMSSGVNVRKDLSEDRPREKQQDSSWLWGGGRDLSREVD